MARKLTAKDMDILFQEEIDYISLDDEDEESNDNSFKRESYDYDFDKDQGYSKDEELKASTQLNDIISFDSIKLLLPLTLAEKVGFEVERDKFFRCSNSERPATQLENMNNLVGAAEKPVQTMVLNTREETYADKSMEYEYAKTKYPNAKPFFDFERRLGIGHMYFKNEGYICQINGKSVASKGQLGLINRNNINVALDKLKGNLIRFDNDKFIDNAQVILTHVTNDIKVNDIKSNIKAFSSFLPLRTDKFNVIKYTNKGYEILPRGKQHKTTAKNSLCIYVKGSEIAYRNQTSYKKIIGRSGVITANKTLRIELRLYNYKAIRTDLAPHQKDGTLTLRELLNCEQTPILQKFAELEITQKNLKKAKGEYISFSEDKLPTLAQLVRMHGIIHLLKLNDYSLDKVRSYLEVEIGREVRSDELKRDREILQRYLACYKPRTVAIMTELLACMSY